VSGSYLSFSRKNARDSSVSPYRIEFRHAARARARAHPDRERRTRRRAINPRQRRHYIRIIVPSSCVPGRRHAHTRVRVRAGAQSALPSRLLAGARSPAQRPPSESILGNFRANRAFARKKVQKKDRCTGIRWRVVARTSAGVKLASTGVNPTHERCNVSIRWQTSSALVLLHRYIVRHTHTARKRFDLFTHDAG